MKHSTHIKLCALFVVATYVLVVAHAYAWAVVAALGCAVMMGAMFWITARPGGPRRR
jgi:hypothetical protein